MGGEIRALRQSGDDMRVTGSGVSFGITGMLFTLAIAGETVMAQTTVPRSTMQQLAVQLRKDIPGIRDCDTKKEFPFTARAVDLNGDKLVEYLLTSVNECECGQVNCSQWVYGARKGGFEFLLAAEGYVLNPRDNLHNGYRDLETTSRDNAAIIDHNRYAFNGTKYERSESRIENLDTHESKPTLQRVRFATGKSSAIVSGSASPSFGDSWVLDAKKGQTLRLAVATVSGAPAKFTLVGPGRDGDHVIVDSQSSWGGTLPESGTYTILVDTTNDLRANYRLSISIP